MGEKYYVFATGGLGNQLFQVAAALESDYEELRVIPNRSNARKSSRGNLDIEDFNFGDQVIFDHEVKLWKLSGKAVNYTLRYFAGRKSGQSRNPYEALVLFAANHLLSANFWQRVQIVANYGLGFDPKIKDKKSKNFFIGYFQTYKVLDNLKAKNIMSNINLITPSKYVEEFEVFAGCEKPLIVHVRMGDYQDSDQFGILPKSYYKEAINLLWGSGLYKKIWLFSDEPEKAQEQIPENLREHLRVIPDFENSTSITFEVMRLGYGYVIANSTFSWWAASLSHNLQGKIAAPDIWFAKSTSPEQILSPDWIKVSAWK
jgi:hypothetical protein